MVTSTRFHHEQGPVLFHHWIRHTEQEVFHAYLSVRPGVVSVCGIGKSFDSVHEMDVPGARSKCCALCCEVLLGPFGYRNPLNQSPPDEESE